MKLIDYITGNRKGREARRIEREAMDDPFLHDALEGYDAVPGDPGDAIRRMQRRVTGAAGKLRRRIYWSAAAALLLCAGAGGYLLTLRNIPMQEPAIALRQDTPERSVPADSVVLAAATPEKSRPEAKTAAETPSVYPEETPAAEDRAPLAKQEAEYAENEKSRPGETVAGSFRRKPFAGRGRPAGRCRHRRRTQRPPGENAILRSGLPGIRFRKNLPENRETRIGTGPDHR